MRRHVTSNFAEALRSPEEIAKILKSRGEKITVNTVIATLKRARRKLRKLLQDEE